MPSLVQGYSYDIFISYRQNDNLDGWVTEFVANLERELRAIIKDPVSVYFDQNPHDGLLETHSVDKSLEGKLNCVIFIPILSQTYCDIKSYAWLNEFCAFNSQVSSDNIGREVKLSNGNVSSRILPVRIHELEVEDRHAFETESGGPIRAVDFIYREAGVNRPLKMSDNRSYNLNQTDYRNQVNKLAHAVKDILAAIRNPASPSIAAAKSTAVAPKPSYARLIAIVAVVVVILGVVYLVYRSFGVSSDSSIEKSIAVLPFTDLTPDHKMEYFGDGISDEIINALTTIKDLKVAGRTSSFQFKNEKVDLRTIGQKLGVSYVLEGSVQKFEDQLRITVQLIRTNDNFHVWSHRFDLREVNIFKIQDAIATSVVEKLKVTLSDFEKGQLSRKETTEAAYAEYLKGMHRYKANQYRDAIPFFLRAIDLDAAYAPPYAFLGISVVRSIDRTHADSVAMAVNLAKRAIELDPDLPEGYSAMGIIGWMGVRDFAMAQEYFEKSIELNPSSSLTKNRYGYFLTWMGDFQYSTRMAREALNLDPVDVNSYYLLFLAAHFSNNADSARKVLDAHRRAVGTDGLWIRNTSTLYCMLNKPEAAIHFLDSASRSDYKLDEGDMGTLSSCYWRVGQKERSDSMLALLRKVRRKDQKYYQIARIFAIQGKMDSCLNNLELSVRNFETAVVSLKVDPDFNSVRQHPHYRELYRSIGFDSYKPRYN